MCGICGFFAGDTIRPKQEAVLDMWAKTEERGKDASGFAASVNGHLWSLRAPRPASQLIAKLRRPKIKNARSWIGHCRLATQGDQKDNENNHPFVRQGLALIHNGMIFNYYELSGEDGCKELKGDCDSEIILATILKYRRRHGVTGAIKRMAKKLEGPMACALINRNGEMWLWHREHNHKWSMTPIQLAVSTTTPNVNFASTKDILRRSIVGNLSWDMSSLANNEGAHIYTERGKLTIDRFHVPDYEGEPSWPTRHTYVYDPFDHEYSTQAHWCPTCSTYYVNKCKCDDFDYDPEGYEVGIRRTMGDRGAKKSMAELRDDALYACEDCGIWLTKEEVLNHKVRNAHYTYREELTGESEY